MRREVLGMGGLCAPWEESEPSAVCSAGLQPAML